MDDEPLDVTLRKTKKWGVVLFCGLGGLLSLFGAFVAGVLAIAIMSDEPQEAKPFVIAALVLGAGGLGALIAAASLAVFA